MPKFDNLPANPGYSDYKKLISSIKKEVKNHPVLHGRFLFLYKTYKEHRITVRLSIDKMPVHCFDLKGKPGSDYFLQVRVSKTMMYISPDIQTVALFNYANSIHQLDHLDQVIPQLHKKYFKNEEVEVEFC